MHVKNRSMDDLLRTGWTYSGTLGVYLNTILAPRDEEDDEDFVPVEGPLADLHGTVAVFVLGAGGRRTLAPLDPSGHLFREPGLTLYRAHRVNGRRLLSVHPAMHEHLNRLLKSNVQRNVSKSNVQRNVSKSNVQRNVSKSNVQRTVNRNVKRNVKRGGGGDPDCVLGEGKRGSFVFKSRCIKDYVLRGESVCENMYDNYPSRCGALEQERTPLHGPSDSTYPLPSRHQQLKLVLKINENALETMDEIYRNSQVHKWLSEKKFMNLCALHPTVSHLSVYDKDDRVTDLIALRQMDGDVKHLKGITEREVYELAGTTITVLNVLHKNKHLHLDIKPANILHGRDVADPYSRNFAVTDYGILTSMEDVARMVQTTGYSGTLGYMSPMLLATDEHNRVLPKFKDILYRARGVELSLEELELTFRAKREQLRQNDADFGLFAKIDLQSLGLTLHRILRDGTHLSSEAQQRINDFTYGLIFYDDLK
ncbi:Serine/threonine-protein kinase PknB, partial [Tetrabaena socialis]